MLWQLGEVPHVLADELGGAVVVVEDGEDALGDGVVGDAGAHVQAEEELDERVDEQRELVLEQRADRFCAVLLLCA